MDKYIYKEKYERTVHDNIVFHFLRGLCSVCLLFNVRTSSHIACRAALGLKDPPCLPMITGLDVYHGTGSALPHLADCRQVVLTHGLALSVTGEYDN